MEHTVCSDNAGSDNFWPNYYYNQYLTILTIKTRLLCIYICNELIEETAGHRKLIFGMWEYFGYGSSKF